MSAPARLHAHAPHPLAHAGSGARRNWLADWLDRAGVQLDGPRPWDPRIVRPRAFRRAARGTLEAGRAFVDGDWTCAALDEFIARMARAAPAPSTPQRLVDAVLTWLPFNRQSVRHARSSIHAHYDQRPELFRAMLGPSLTYSCGYWAHARSLEEAQDAKHELIARKIGLQPGMHVLDVGCGWGAFAEFAARHHGARVTGVTLSDEQAAFARTRTGAWPVEILLDDFRRVSGTFDRVVSVGMFEHVGPKNYRTFFRKLAGWLRPDGLALLHSIGNLRSAARSDPWLDHEIFPGSVLPSAAEITAACEGLFVIEDWHNFGADYDRTLRAWHANLTRAWAHELSGDPEPFRRRWTYYLLMCAGLFRARYTQLWQIVLSPKGVPGGYRRPADPSPALAP